MSRRRHVPIRTCIGCGVRAPQQAMIRIARDESAALLVDRARQAAGRGGYLHPSRDCWRRFSHRKGFVRSLRVAVDRAARTALVGQLERTGIERGRN